MCYNVINSWNFCKLKEVRKVPIVDYICEKCGAAFFEIVNSPEEKVICPRCGNEEVKKVYKGKYYGNKGCSGNCGNCNGCGH